MNNTLSDPNSLQFCPVLAELVQSRRTIGTSGKVFNGIGALSSRNNLLTLRRLLLALKPERTLEIGLSFGGSALVFAASHKDLGRTPGRQHIALDPYQKAVWDSCGLLAVERSDLSGYLDFRPAFSAFELPKLIESGEQFGLIYVDGSHLVEDVFVDAYFGMRLLMEGGVIAFDDSSTDHVRKVISFFRSNLRDLCTELDLSPYRRQAKWASRRRYQLARALGKVQLIAFRQIGPTERKWDAPFRSF